MCIKKKDYVQLLRVGLVQYFICNFLPGLQPHKIHAMLVLYGVVYCRCKLDIGTWSRGRGERLHNYTGSAGWPMH